MLVRLRQPGDEATIADLLGPDTHAPGARVQLAEENGQVVGAALWAGTPGGVAQLGAVVPADPNRRDVFYALIRAAAQAMKDEGFERGAATVYDSAVLALLKRHFDINPQESGWEPLSRRPVEWRIELAVSDAIAQLDAALDRLAGRGFEGA